MRVGIDDISVYTSEYFLDLATLAHVNNIDPSKYYKGLGQERMAVLAPDDDIVTLAASAAKPIIDRHGVDAIHTVLFATETGIDQSKAAGVYVHRLLGLQDNCRVVELKQACYGSTAALQMACALVARQPGKNVLVIASDNARYERDTPAEPTQGCGAVAMLITANPKIMTVGPVVGNHTEDVMDFWRPNYSSTAHVDGKLSTDMYMRSLEQAWHHYVAETGETYFDFARFCYHLPFSRMGEKAHTWLSQVCETGLSNEERFTQIEDSLRYNRVIGNTYTASLYFSLCSLLDNSVEDLTGEKICMFSYGSGCVAELFSGTVEAGYRQHLRADDHAQLLTNRSELDYNTYVAFYDRANPVDGSRCELPSVTSAPFRLAAIDNHQRVYTS